MLFRSLNSDGYGRVAEVRGTWDRWYLFPFANGTGHRLDFEMQAFHSWRNGALTDVVASMLVHRFNLTFGPSWIARDLGATPYPILCLQCGLAVSQHTELVLLTMDEYAHLYCTRKATLQQASLVFFLRPFDMWSWACLAALTLLFAVGLLAFGNSGVRFQQVWYTLDIL